MIKRIDKDLLRMEDQCPHCKSPIFRVLRGDKWICVSKVTTGQEEVRIEVSVECYSCGKTTRFTYTGPRSAVS